MVSSCTAHPLLPFADEAEVELALFGASAIEDVVKV